MRLKLGLQHCNFPFFWRFNHPIPVKRRPLLPRFEQELYADFHKGFQAAYTVLLQAFATRDHATLSEALDYKLNQRVFACLSRLHSENKTLEVVNPYAAVSLSLWNSRIHVFPPYRNRPKSKLTEQFRVYYNVSDSEDLTEPSSDREEPRVRLNDMQVWACERQKQAVLRVDCRYFSCQKLVLRKGDGEIVRGKADTSLEEHWIRFESSFPVSDSEDIMDYFLYGEGESPIQQYAWTATDIDLCLGGNKYAARPFKFPFPRD